MAVFEIKIPCDKQDVGLSIADDGKSMAVKTTDYMGDVTLIKLSEPQRSEFIRKVSELKQAVK